MYSLNRSGRTPTFSVYIITYHSCELTSNSYLIKMVAPQYIVQIPILQYKFQSGVDFKTGFI
ncbi:hypothetical protein Hanom_Chr09g00779921 [Helianthus anomalus]